MTSELATFSLKLEHCLICLTPQSPAWASEFLRCNEIQDFQPLLNYLTGSSHEENLEILTGGDEPPGDHYLNPAESRTPTNVLLPMLKHCPPLCERCYGELKILNELNAQLLRLQSEIALKIDAIRQLVRSTVEVNLGPQIISPRDGFMRYFQQSDLPKELTSLISNFVIGLHRQILDKDEGSIQFPHFQRLKTFHIPEEEFQEHHFQIVDGPTEVESQIEIYDDDDTSIIPATQPSLTLVEVVGSSALGQDADGAGDNDMEVIGTSNVAAVETNIATAPVATTASVQTTASATVTAGVEKKRRRGPPKGKSSEPLYQFCDLCNEKLKLGAEVQTHLQEHVGPEYTFYCTGCKHGYITPFRLYQYHRRRRRTHKCPMDNCPEELVNQYKPHLYCDICKVAKFFRYKEYQVHMEFHETDEKNFECPLCPAKFTLQKNVEIHLEETHFYQEAAGGITQRCELCKHPEKVSEMFLHLKKKHGCSEIFACKLCPKMFPSLKSMIQHQENVRLLKKSGQGHPMCCHICAEKFVFLESYHKHLHEKHGVGQKFICGLCDAELLSKKAWKYHMKSRHPKEPQLEDSNDVDGPAGEEKPYDTTQQSSIPTKRARVSKGPPVVRRYSCQDCSRTFCAKDLVLKHRVLEHGHPPPTCQTCNQSFNCRSELLKHTRIAHLGITDTKSDLTSKEAIHACDSCGLKFVHPFQLRYHVAEKHSTDTPFVCETCGKGFKGGGKGKSRLKDHIKKAHLNIKPEKKLYKTCEECGKNCYDKRIYEEHMYTHTGQRPFSCDFCQQRFRQKSCLKMHLKSHEELGESFKPKGEMERGTKKNKDKN